MDEGTYFLKYHKKAELHYLTIDTLHNIEISDNIYFSRHLLGIPYYAYPYQVLISGSDNSASLHSIFH